MVSGKTHRASVYESYEAFKVGIAPVAKGDITLGEYIFADWKDVNKDPAVDECH